MAPRQTSCGLRVDRTSLDLLCPSAQPTVNGAVAIGVVEYAERRAEIAYLERPLPASPGLLRLAEPVRPTEIFRFAAPCQQSACEHWSGADCKLIRRIVQFVPPVSESLPRCHIRTQCRWYAEQGRPACLRCPSVVTQDEAPTPAMRHAALPQ
jgi:hypothetical protein